LLLLSVVVVVVVVIVVVMVADCSVGQWTGLEGGKYVGMIGRTMDGNILQGGEEELVFLIVIVCVFILRLRGSRMENVEIDLFLMMTMIDLFFVCFTGPSRMMCGRLVVLLPVVVVVVGRGSIAIPGGGNGGFILYFYFFVFFAVLFFTQ